MKLLPLSFKTAEENLAFEEYYFEHFEEDTLRLWMNPASVVVGKHQNAMAEANVRFCNAENIPVIRRISGGGTVYHDLGNINFSFFRRVPQDKMIDYHRNLNIIHEMLNELGYPVNISPRHDLFLNDFKISGNAQHVKRGKSLHHGTILYDANLNALSSGIKRTQGEFIDKGVKSVRSPITNLREFHDLGETVFFQSSLVEWLSNYGLKITPNEVTEFQTLIQPYLPKYFSEEWNYGYSPNYIFKNSIDDFKLEIEVSRGGKIENAKIQNGEKRWFELENFIIGKLHYYNKLGSGLKSHFGNEEYKLIETLLF